MTTRPAMIRALTFEVDGVVIDYCLPGQDARANGVILNHVMYIPTGGDYADEIEAVTFAAAALIADVLEDLPNIQPMPEDIDDTDDDDDDEDDDDEHEHQATDTTISDPSRTV